jgi:hypothetical protein
MSDNYDKLIIKYNNLINDEEFIINHLVKLNDN